ncbi:hypothetical protein NTGHW29_100022 [Candidatus Nitrotoga sp. HW29]|nr:hypothetical protein NTGHW29_100022 [Candidatus Nitrotoga sp. HW29]
MHHEFSSPVCLSRVRTSPTSTLSADGLLGKHFDYMLSNPPFGVEWKKIENKIRKEFE